MNFKQIEMFGFKSFADKLEIKFENGITAIVGPNGCGKSNVADATRWVLGEQSSKLLRANNMLDLIFNGTEKRKSLSYCEVSATFDNSDRHFDIDYNEIIITRKLYRSGESEYFMNKTPCRLKDITNLLHDSGIGKDGYSIIGQGKVEEIISAKPEDRRTIFDEAAGISKFKARKVDAERKLLRTQENLIRSQDILSEIERQLGPLKYQAENAKKYLEFKEKLKTFEVNNYIYQYDNANSQKAKIQTKIDGYAEELAVKQADFERKNNKYNANMLEINKIDSTISELHEKILSLTINLEKSSGESKVAEEKVKFLVDRQRSIEDDLIKQKLNLENANIQLDSAKKALSENDEKLKLLSQSETELTKKYLLLTDELTSSENEEALKQQQMLDALAQLGDIKSNQSALIAKKEAFEKNIKELEIRQENNKQKIVQKKKEQLLLTDNIKKLSGNLVNTNDEITNINGEISKINLILNELASSIFTAKSNMQIVENRKNALDIMQKDFEGYNYSVKRLMQDSKTSSVLKEQIVGVVASLMTIPKGFEIAIETALGGAVQNIVTKNEEDSKDLIKYLKNNNIGRATFLPISAMRSKGLSGEEYRYTKTANCHGVASEIVKYDKRLSAVFESLLGRCVIVETINDAVALAKSSNFAFKIVTMDGDVINPQGSMSGGSAKALTSNLLMREAEIENLNQNIEKFKTALNEKVKEQEKLQKSLEGYTLKQNSLNSQKIDLQIDLAKQNEVLQQVSKYLSELEIERQDLSDEKFVATTNVEAIEITISQIGAKESSINLNNSQQMSDYQEKYKTLKINREKVHEKLTSIKVEVAGKEQEILSINSEISRLDNYTLEVNMVLSALSKNLNDTNEILSQAKDVIITKKNSESFFETERDISEYKQHLSSFDGKKQELQKQVKELDEFKSVLSNEINNIINKKYQEEFNLGKVDTDIEAMQERIFKEYELTYSSCLEYKQEEYDLYKGISEANKLKKEISRLGNVNVNAIEDSKLLIERFDNLNNQAEDLIKAKEDLIKIIKEMSVEMTTRFDTAFKLINENFGKVFKELFGGGNAKLILTESDDPLEAGVDIIAEPPDKKIQSISLLSGGEKALTAIAILFAILKLKPMPFCLLDEIEAALDETNVDRFANYLKKYSGETQFIVITHRKPTMELSDCLYGVTMEEKGVSKLVSVKFEDAVKSAT